MADTEVTRRCSKCNEVLIELYAGGKSTFVCHHCDNSIRKATAKAIAQKLRDRCAEIRETLEPASALNELRAKAAEIEREYEVK